MDGQVNLEAIKNVGKVDALSAVYKGKWIKILAYPAILRFKKRHPKQKYCCVTKSNLLSKKKMGWLRHCYRTVCWSNY